MNLLQNFIQTFIIPNFFDLGLVYNYLLFIHFAETNFSIFTFIDIFHYLFRSKFGVIFKLNRCHLTSTFFLSQFFIMIINRELNSKFLLFKLCSQCSCIDHHNSFFKLVQHILIVIFNLAIFLNT